MKRSEVLDIIAAWAKPEIFEDVYGGNHTEWADNLLYTLETELKFKRVEINNDGSSLEEVPYEPEEGWDAWLEEQHKKDETRDFQVVLTSKQKINKEWLYRSQVVAQEFLNGKSFEELADQYNVTRERIRQIVDKERRRYQKSLEENSEK